MGELAANNEEEIVIFGELESCGGGILVGINKVELFRGCEDFWLRSTGKSCRGVRCEDSGVFGGVLKTRSGVLFMNILSGTFLVIMLLLFVGGLLPKSGLNMFSILNGNDLGLCALGGGDKGNLTSG